MNIQLLIIDPQNDFCDAPADWHLLRSPQAQPGPALPVPGAHADMQRLARWIGREGARLDAITLTLDSHQRYDIAHPVFWQHRDGGEVAPFTPITAADVRAGALRPRDPHALDRTLRYLDALDAQGRYQLMVWPVHCEIGSWGHGVHADVLAACGHWQQQRQRAVYPLFKGMNPWTEHYSALQAEVPDPTDPASLLNQELLARLDRAQRIIIAGEASSHCVRATTEHLVQHLPGGRPERLILLHDAMSPVAGFESAHEEFLAVMHACGVQLVSSEDLNL